LPDCLASIFLRMRDVARDRVHKARRQGGVWRDAKHCGRDDRAPRNCSRSS
jgi:hypothetical protein